MSALFSSFFSLVSKFFDSEKAQESPPRESPLSEPVSKSVPAQASSSFSELLAQEPHKVPEPSLPAEAPKQAKEPALLAAKELENPVLPADHRYVQPLSKRKEQEQRAADQADAALFAAAIAALGNNGAKNIAQAKGDLVSPKVQKIRRRAETPKKRVPLPHGERVTSFAALSTAVERARKESPAPAAAPKPANKSANVARPKPKKVLRQEEASVQDTLAADRLFFEAMQGTVPLPGRAKVVAKEPPRVPKLPSNDQESLLEGQYAFELFCRDEYVQGNIATLDAMTLEKLKAGGFSPEAHLDLHGCTVAAAYDVLHAFIRDCWYKGLRTLLVIPGRGNNSFGGRSILRVKLTEWLTQEPFKRVVLAFCTAQPIDGGPGSMYILMRKCKKKGRVFWERTAFDSDLL